MASHSKACSFLPLQFVPLTVRPYLSLFLTCLHRSDILHLGRDKSPPTSAVNNTTSPCGPTGHWQTNAKRSKRLVPPHPHPCQQCFLIQLPEVWSDWKNIHLGSYARVQIHVQLASRPNFSSTYKEGAQVRMASGLGSY